jgi:hypothetical protein
MAALSVGGSGVERRRFDMRDGRGLWTGSARRLTWFDERATFNPLPLHAARNTASPADARAFAVSRWPTCGMKMADMDCVSRPTQMAVAAARRRRRRRPRD